jgi:predicted acyltransferase
MKLTAAETKALELLQKQERTWRWFRFVELVVGLGIIIAGFWQVREINHHLLETTRNMSATDHPTGMEVYFASVFGGQLAVAFILPTIGGAIVAHVLARWRGNPSRRLLIGLASAETRAEGPVA